MTYKLFLDDERFPPGNESEWVIVRSYDEAVVVFEDRGGPTFMSFDHDLGLAETGYDVALYMVNRDLDNPGFITPDFAFEVHSMNPIGAKNIRGLLSRYLEHRE